MNHFKTTANNKWNFINSFLENENLVKCLANNETNFLDYEVEDKESLIYDRIHPTKYVPGVNESAKSFICMSFQYSSSKASAVYYRVTSVTFYIFCHRSLMRTDYGVTRADYMLSCVDEIIHNSKSEEWMGRMLFEAGNDEILDANGEYVGLWARYKAVEMT